MKSVVVFLLLFWATNNSYAQSQSKVFVVTDAKNRLPGYPFRFTVNGNSYTLKSGDCLELYATGDSVHIKMEDRRWINPETRDLSVAAGGQIYVHLMWGWMTGDKKKIRAMAILLSEKEFTQHREECRKRKSE